MVGTALGGVRGPRGAQAPPFGGLFPAFQPHVGAVPVLHGGRNLGVGPAHELFGPRTLRFQRFLIVVDEHGVVIPLAPTVLPLEARLMKNPATRAQIESTACAFTDRLGIYTHLVIPLFSSSDSFYRKLAGKQA